MSHAEQDNYMWERLTCFQNLLAAFKLAARGRRGHAAVAEFERCQP